MPWGKSWQMWPGGSPGCCMQPVSGNDRRGFKAGGMDENMSAELSACLPLLEDTCHSAQVAFSTVLAEKTDAQSFGQ